MRLAFLCTLTLLGCGEPKSSCTPGQSVACACIGGALGAQLCRPDGTFDACDCGDPGRTSNLPDLGGDNNNPVHLPDLAMPTSPTGTKRIFVTSTAYGATVLSTVCQDSADAASLGGTWKAWLSDGFADAIDKIQGTGPWVLLDGTIVFQNHGQLATHPLALINVTEDGQVITDPNIHVWTGTANGGRASGGYTCGSWTSTGTYAAVGSVVAGTDYWTYYTTDDCAYSNHVYCFEQ